MIERRPRARGRAAEPPERPRRCERDERTEHAERGSILMLILGFAAIAVMAIGVLASATGLYLAERRLVSIADAAALDASESYDLGSASVSGGAVSARLEPGDVAASAAGYVERLGRDRFDSLELVSATTPDGRSVAVTVRAMWRPPLVGELLPSAVELTATSEARAALG